MRSTYGKGTNNEVPTTHWRYRGGGWRHGRNCELGNGVGRVFWAWASDLITRRATFAVMFILQVLLFWFLPTITTSSMMTIVVFVILMCYGAGAWHHAGLHR